ncbi:hypothetical protein [Nocardia gipuzkoensis]|uniref:hypothetical protein n=1 Tax=Nocardia gipuzkoensis TaxID=2749991 RepID=UPI00237DEB36|nr:hypothetical protein [Nocardia gipuzkoensis]MDE1675421.1 hypothetical protein [Nocardia gipuzkoensis]
MSYDFAVIPAADVGSVEQAVELYLAMCATPDETAPSPAVCDFVDEINHRYGGENGGFLSVETAADVRGAVVCTWWPSLTRNLRMVLDLTKGRGLAVLDPQTRRLYDPRGRADVLVTVGDGTVLPYLTKELLADLLADPPDPANPFLVVEREEQHYVQTCPDSDGVYELEYRAGSPDQHFRVHTSDRALVGDVIWAWSIDNPWWRDAVDWREVNQVAEELSALREHVTRQLAEIGEQLAAAPEMILEVSEVALPLAVRVDGPDGGESV